MLRTTLRAFPTTARPTPSAFVAVRSYASNPSDPNAKSTVRKAGQALENAGALDSSKPAGERIDKAARLAGAAKDTSPENPSVISSAGAVGKQFNPDGAIGQIGEKIGGVFSKDGAVGSQFDASKDGLAGQVEKAVDGPSQKKK